MDNSLTTFAWIAFLYCLIAIFLSIKNKIVFYYDRKDALMSVSPPLVVLIFVFVFHSFATEDDTQPNGYQLIALAVGAMVVAVLYIKSAITFFRHNGLLQGFIFLPSKIIISLFLVLAFIGLLRNTNDRETRRNNAVALAILVSIFAFVWTVLINGRDVMTARAVGVP